MNHTLTALTMAAVALAGTAAQAQAADYTATLVADGWIRANGQSNGATPENDYLAGNLRRSGEYRNFFTFDVPVYSGDITSATLSMPTESTSFSQSPGMIYQVTSTGSQSFGSLGTGTVYGSMTYDQASQPVVSII